MTAEVTLAVTLLARNLFRKLGVGTFIG